MAVATRFRTEKGVILELKNGNKSIQNDTILEFATNQPRYMNVAFISGFADEKELLFYGNGVILEISRIYHDDVNKNTLNQLNVLQQILTNKKVNFNGKKIKKYTEILCKRLKEINKLNTKSIKENLSYKSLKYNATCFMNKITFVKFLRQI